MSDGAIISAKEVVRTYKGNGEGFTALHGVSMEVAQGEFVAMMGPSGCGKSTLLNIFGGIDRPDAGQVDVCGTQLEKLNETGLALFRRKNIGIVFQFFNLILNLNVVSNIELPALLAGESAGRARSRAMDLLTLLGIESLMNKMPNQLSGGQQQRVAICRALINRPRLLLADEPTGALDRSAGQAVMELFRQVHGQGQTIFMVTHDPSVAEHAQRILTMEDGRVVSTGGTRLSDAR